MTTIASDPDKLRELDAEERRAWNAYRDRTQSLAGEEYELAETESWTALQGELRRVERRRHLLGVAAAAEQL
ncbi:MAG TPA: hypothetical protein VFP55_10110 [Solirubrobacteraceae bacterium]|nr:hypothetical protein [Solirubrobacteraceae bacterium]